MTIDFITLFSRLKLYKDTQTDQHRNFSFLLMSELLKILLCCKFTLMTVSAQIKYDCLVYRKNLKKWYRKWNKMKPIICSIASPIY